MTMEDRNLDIYTIFELSQVDPSERKLDTFSLQSLYTLEEHAAGNFLAAIRAELRLRSLPRLAKITAGWVVVAALRYKIITGASCDPTFEEALECDPDLHCSLCTPLLELVKFAFSEDCDGDMYDDLSVLDDAEDMSYEVMWKMRRDRYLLETFESGGEEASPENILAACITVLQGLGTNEGKLFNEIAFRLERDRCISAKEVRELVQQHKSA